MAPFHTIIHYLAPATRVSVRQLSLGTFRDLEAWDLSPADLTEPWPLEFMAAFERLEALPRMFIELDGSFVWVGDSPEPYARWQLDGLINDSPQGVMTIEAKGTLTDTGWTTLRRLLVPDDGQLAFQMVREGIYLPEAQFLRAFVVQA